jgi:hypothetical protein
LVDGDPSIFSVLDLVFDLLLDLVGLGVAKIELWRDLYKP